MKDLTPRKIVEYLDEYIVGQQDAKRSVAVALRNRWRSSRLPKEIAREVSPKNILLIGPTGVGKTEIARRIAALTGAPFVKVEATKYTEVGYVGRNVESMGARPGGRSGAPCEEAGIRPSRERCGRGGGAENCRNHVACKEKGNEISYGNYFRGKGGEDRCFR